MDRGCEHGSRAWRAARESDHASGDAPCKERASAEELRECERLKRPEEAAR